MAPELRKRSKSKAAAESPAVKRTDKAGKRKATEEASPIAVKKQKGTEAVDKPKSRSKKRAVEAAETEPIPTPVKKKENKKANKKSKTEDVEPKEVEVEVEAEEDETILVPAEDGSDSEEEIDEDIQALAAGLDPDDAEDGRVVDGPSYEPGQEDGKIPKLSKKDKKALAAKKGTKEEPGVIYVGRIPHGFYEHALRSYFSQFGPVTRLRMARNKRTGASKHFAFIEFADESTSVIAAKTMDGYLLYNHILKVKTVPRDQLHEDVWKGANRRFKKTPWSKIEGKKLARPLTEAGWENRISREQKKRAKRAEKLKDLGYEFEVPQLKAPPAPVEASEQKTAEKPKAIEEAPSAEAKGTAEEDKEVKAPAAEPKAQKEKKEKKEKAKKGKKVKA
ncbi:hypothetical protein SODALDRAFT_326627 [Sodiomyces alkalinus F11]|uniref:RRM domain-containing protein n=1 Tax=Sodiomyces alkalinus (strain CBS 110278 / VKM F-3762 / F11) TaxID=1314773 RepID=A0A3N2Q6R9_SODAK|nr:hypothetical protein SODALDRAFT_326627 [Sodiomyces alkalinus F11]ROT42471.1 hypothetical protein SODALDRAFT_326627 [Sodiomyces alkalinus F11]